MGHVWNGVRVGSVAACLALAGGTVGGQQSEVAPYFFYLPSQDDNSALSMECHGTPPFNSMSCRFTQVTVSRPASGDAKSQQEAIAELDSMPWDKLRALRDDMCGNLNAPKTREWRLIPRQGSAKAAGQARALAMIRPICGCRDAACVRAQFSAYLALERETCKVWVNTFDVDFKRASRERRWVSNSEPEGLCNVVTAIVIEQEAGDKAGVKWTYTQTRLAADTTSPLCKAFELNVPAVNSWKALGTISLDCKSIEFGL